MLISMALAALLTMSDDHEGDFDAYIWKLNGIVISVCVFRFLLWCAKKLRRLGMARNGNRDDDDGSSISVYIWLRLFGIFALVDSIWFLIWCVKKVQRIMRRRRI